MIKENKRDVVLDVMKGITIIAVIVGHWDNCADISDILLYKIVHKVIYSFHMPLFFIVAGYFFRHKSFYYDFKRLFYPYLFLALASSLYLWISSIGKPYEFQMERVSQFVTRALWGSGGYSEAPLFGKVPDYLPVWFLCALLWCKQVFSVVTLLVEKCFKGNLYALGIVSFLLSLLFTYIDRRVIYIPLSFNQGLSAIIFFYFGYMARQLRNREFIVKKWHLLMISLIVVVNLPWGTILLAGCKYQCYYLNILGASGTTFLIYYLCKKYIVGIPVLVDFFSWAGVHSMLILCVHSFLIETRLLYPPPSYPIIVLVVSIMYSCIGVWLLSKLKIIRYLFQLR